MKTLFNTFKLIKALYQQSGVGYSGLFFFLALGECKNCELSWCFTRIKSAPPAEANCVLIVIVLINRPEKCSIGTNVLK